MRTHGSARTPLRAPRRLPGGSGGLGSVL